MIGVPIVNDPFMWVNWYSCLDTKICPLFQTKSLKCSMPLLIAPAEGWGALLALWGHLPPLHWNKIVILSRIFIFLESVLKKLFIWSPLIYVFISGSLGVFFSFLVFENFETVFWIIIPTFDGVCFKVFYLRPPDVYLWSFKH